MSFLGGIFGGSSPGLDAALGTAGNISSFGTGVGESAVNAGLGFEEGLLSGNQAEEAQLLAPEISGIAQRANQKTQTNAQFGNRGGGTNASNQTTMDTARASVNDMIAQLTGNAANAVTQTGENLLGTGLSASEAQAAEAEQKLQDERNSLLGNVIGGAVGNFGTYLSGLGSGAFGF